MLFASRMLPGKGLNLEQVILRFGGSIEESYLKAAVSAVIQRHEAMQMTFHWEAGKEPMQVLHPEISLDWTSFGLNDVSKFGSVERQEGIVAERDQEKVLEEYLRADRSRDLAMNQPPLHRFGLFHRPWEGGEAIWVWTFPHALLDGRSIERVLADVLDCYSANLKGRPWNGAPVEGCRDFYRWLGPFLESAHLAHAEMYWKSLLTDYVTPQAMILGAAPRHLPTEPVPALDALDKSVNETFNERKPVAVGISAGNLEALWEPAFVASLQDFVLRWGGTLNTLLQSAFAFVLSRYLGAEDLLVAAVRNGRHWDNRSHPDAVGLFMNNLPVRFSFKPGQTILDGLKALRSQHMAIRPHEHTPMERIKEWINLPTGFPLFEAVFQYEPATFTDRLHAALPDWRATRVELRETSGVPLILSV